MQKACPPCCGNTESRAFRNRSLADPSAWSVHPVKPANWICRFPWMQDYCWASPAFPQTLWSGSLYPSPRFRNGLPLRLVPAWLQSLHLHDLPCGNPASLHNPSYKYGHLIRSVHNPDYKSPYSSDSDKLHSLFLYTTHCWNSSHTVGEWILLLHSGPDPTGFRSRYAYSDAGAGTGSVLRQCQFPN